MSLEVASSSNPSSSAPSACSMSYCIGHGMCSMVVSGPPSLLPTFPKLAIVIGLFPAANWLAVCAFALTQPDAADLFAGRHSTSQ